MKPYVITGVIGTTLAAAVAVVLFVLARQENREEGCALNLRCLSMAVHEASPLDQRGWDDVPTGSAFWLSHAQWPRAAIRPITPEMLLCPLHGSPEGRKGTDYRGPRDSLRRMGLEDPIAADRPGNHGPGRGGNVLLRSGDLFHVSEDEPLWQRAAEKTGD